MSKKIPHNKKPFSRRPATKHAGRRILIVTEGQTEKTYFDALRRRWKLHGIIIPKNPDCTDPVSLLAYAKKENGVISNLNRGNYDEVWLVYDLEKPNATDRRNQSHQVKNQIETGKKYKNFHLALSDPSFEFWYILHFEKTTKSFTGAEEVISYLKKHLNNYRKGTLADRELESILDRTEIAISNASWVREQLKNSNSPAPVTDIDKLWNYTDADKNSSLRTMCFGAK